MPYESGMDPFHDARRRFDVRFHLLAIAFLVFDVELLFLYPWAVASHPVAIKEARAVQSAEVENSHVSKSQLPLGIDSAAGAGLVKDRELVFLGAMIFIALLTLGFVYDWRKGIFQWH
ncbi:MAG: NADH-quinone oxidoreductase subunit A [Thermoguttaceae bacterium]